MAETKKRKSFRTIMKIIYLGVFLYAAISLIQIGYEYYLNQKVLADIQEIYTVQENETDDGELIRKSFQPLREINTDIVGWITINNTKVDYPILHGDDNEFYLTHNYKKEENLAGSIFMDFRNDKLWYNKHTILYGHRMKDGTMFSQIKKYEDQSFYDANPTFQYETITDRYEVKVFAAYVTTTDFYYIKTDFEETSDFMELVKEMKEKSEIQTNLDVQEDDRIITLSTCDYIYDEGRFVVHGILTKK